MGVLARRHLMAVKTVKVTYCDRCGADEGTARYSIGFPTGQRRTFDLCETCAEPLAHLADLLGKLGERGPKHQTQPVLTPEQVAAQLRKVKKPTKKAASRSRKTG